MISQNQIARLIEAHDHRQLIERILTNGRCRSLTAKRALSHPDVAAVAGLGLALQRISEITYRPAPIAGAIADQLLHLQREDGLFGDAPQMTGDSLLAATAVAVRGVMAFAAQHRAVGLRPDQSICDAIERGLSALTRRLQNPNVHDLDAVDWAIALWQLGDANEFRARVDTDALLAMLDETAIDVIEDELCRYAHAMAA